MTCGARARPRETCGIAAGVHAFDCLRLASPRRCRTAPLGSVAMPVHARVVGLRRRARFAGACAVHRLRFKSSEAGIHGGRPSCRLAPPRSCVRARPEWSAVGIESLTCGACPPTWAWANSRLARVVGLRPRARFARSDGKPNVQTRKPADDLFCQWR